MLKISLLTETLLAYIAYIVCCIHVTDAVVTYSLSQIASYMFRIETVSLDVSHDVPLGSVCSEIVSSKCRIEMVCCRDELKHGLLGNPYVENIFCICGIEMVCCWYVLNDGLLGSPCSKIFSGKCRIEMLCCRDELNNVEPDVFLTKTSTYRIEMG